MKYLLMLFSGLLMFTSCGSSTDQGVEDDVKTEEKKMEPTQQELRVNSQKLIAKILDVSELNIHMNGDSKWVIGDDVFTKLMKVKHQIYVISGNMENYTIESYNEMGTEFFEFVNSIPPVNSPSANEELQKVISSTKNQIVHLSESNLQNAQIAVINLSNIYEIVPIYFEPVSK